MNNIIIDLGLIDTREEFHEVIKKAFLLPHWYGENLDALWDCLMEINNDTKIYLLKSGEISKSLGSYGCKIITLFKELSLENNNISLKIE